MSKVDFQQNINLNVYIDRNIILSSPQYIHQKQKNSDIMLTCDKRSFIYHEGNFLPLFDLPSQSWTIVDFSSTHPPLPPS